jgi:cell division protein ZapA
MESVQVEIFGQVYSIKGMAEPEHIKELADFVDAKMKEIQKGTGTVDPHRVAILAALTISDELYRLRERHKTFEKTTEHAVQRLLEITGGREEAG